MSEQPTRILIIADEALIAMKIKDRLIRLGYAVCGIAALGETALARIAEAKPDLVLVDIDPRSEADDLQTAARLRARTDTPVVFLTTFSDDKRLRQLVNAEPFEYLVKPFEERELHAAIQMALCKHRMERAAREANVRLEERIRERTAEIAASERRLADRDRLMTLLVNATQEGFWFIDNDARTTDLNPAMCAILGRPREDVIGKDIYAFVDRENAEIFRREIALRRRGKADGYRIALSRPDGTKVHCFNNATPVYDANGEKTGSVGMWTDITDLVEAQSRLKVQTSIFDAMLKAMPDGVQVIDAHDRCLADNDQFYELTAIDRKTAHGSPDPVFFCLEELARRGEYGPGEPEALARERRAENRRKLAETGSFAYERLFKHGRWIEARIQAIEGGGLLALYRDTTEAKTREREVERQAELLDTIIKNMGEGISLFDKDMRWVLGNDRGHQLTGADASVAHPGASLREIVVSQARAGEFGPCDDPEAEADRLLSGLRPEKPFIYERDRPNGRSIEVRRNPIGGGGFITIYLDTTERKRAEAALAEANRLLDAVIENMPALVFVKRASDLRYERFNRVAEQLLGRARSELLGKNDHDLFPKEQADTYVARDLAALASDQAQDSGDHPIRPADPETPYIRTLKVALRDASGRPTHVLGVAVDVTDRKRAEDALRELNATLERRVEERTAALAASETNLRAISDNASVGILVLLDGRFAFANRHAARMAGYTVEEVEGLPIADIIHPDYRAELFERHRRRLAGEDVPARYETVALAKDGRSIPVELNAAITRWSGQSAGMVFVTDITERKRTEREIIEVRGHLLDAIESIEHAVLLYDSEDRLILFNQHFVDHYRGIAEVIKVGIRFEDMFRAAVERGLVAIPPGQPADEFVAENVARHRRADGTIRTRQLANGRILQISEHPARNGGIVAVGTDVTERLKTEQQLREAQKMEEIGKLVGGMAHDFNNYLAVIIGNLDLLRERESADPGATTLIDAALGSALRGAELTRSLLAFTRRQPLESQSTDVSRHLDSITHLLKSTLGEDIALTTNFAPGPWPVRIDRAQLDSCIVNLANNARDAMPRGGALAISTRNLQLDELYARENPGTVPGDYVLIEVSDTGDGMPSEILSHVFEPFFTTKPPGHGTGLGLSMVYGFVKQSGGYITVYSEVGHGTAVRIYLPRDPNAEPAASAGPGAAAQASPGTETILVVEDNEAMRKTAVAQLGSLGYRVIGAENGAAALAILDRSDSRIDLLFTDVVMPGKADGYGLATLALERRPGIKILLTSGFPGDALRHSGKHAANLRLLGKPYRKGDLARAVRETLASEAPGPDSTASSVTEK